MASYDRSLRLALGSLLVGCQAAVFLQGILFVQFYHYIRKYRDDRTALKLVVAGLVLLTTLKICQSFAMMWIEFIDSFADLGSALMNFATNWTLQGNPLMVAALGSYVRAYFCYRLLVISKVWWPVLVVATTDLIALSFVAVGINLLRVNPLAQNEILLFYTLHFSLVFVGDLLLSLLTAFFLLRSKKRVLPQSEGFINALIWLTFETATPGALCSLISLIFSRLSVNGFQIISAFNEILPQLYAVSMMWTLNAREELRSLSGGLATTYTGRHLTKEGTGTIHRDDMELGFEGIKIQTEVVTHVNDHVAFPGPDTSTEAYNMGEAL